MAGQIGRDRLMLMGVTMSVPEDVGEPEHRDDGGGVVLGEVAHESLDLEQRSLDPRPRRGGARPSPHGTT